MKAILRTGYMSKYCNCILIVFLIFTISCSADDSAEDNSIWEERADSVPVSEEHGNYHILIIGNSLSRDAFSYVPAIMKNLCPKISVEMAIYYKGGVALNAHWNSLENSIRDHSLDLYTTENDRWVTQANVIGQEVFKSKSWDLIILQEGNVKSRYYVNTHPNIECFVKYIQSLQNETKVAYMINPAQPEGSSVLGEYTSDDVWKLFAITANELLDRNDVDYIIPCGTAIQNARRTYLDSFGLWGHLTFDGVHLQEGIPCLIDAFAATQAILNIFDIKASIMDSNIKITQSWVKRQNILGQHGDVIEGTYEDYILSKRCASMAIENPIALME